MEKLRPTLRSTQNLIKRNIQNDLHNLEEIREKIEDIVSFFSETDPHQGAQLYFEMRIENMLAPFVNLFRFIDQHETESKKIKDYLSSNPSLLLDGLFQILKKALPNQEIELESIHGQMIHFSILIREFTLLYGTFADYLDEFGTYTFRDNIVDFYKKGNLIAGNLIHFLATQSLSKTPMDVEILADFYLRKSIFKSYRLSLTINNEQCLQEHKIAYTITKNKISQLKALAIQAIPVLDKLPQITLDDQPLAQKLRNYYQIQTLSNHPDLEELHSITNNTKQRSIGFELEFNSGGLILNL